VTTRTGIKLLALATLALSSLAHAAPEYRIKAAFLYNLARMVEWPNENILTAKEPFAICFLGAEPFGDALDGMSEKQVRNRPIVLHKDIVLGQVKQCAMLFISASENGRLEEILKELKGLPLLTVADEEGFAARGVIANMLRDDKKVRLEVNTRVAKEAGLNISPTLLELAVKVGEAK